MTSDPTLQDLSVPVREYLTPILEETLALCAERHALAEGKGADGFSFGTDAWSLPDRVFKEKAGEGVIPFDTGNGDGSALAFGPIRIRHHRVGETEHDDILVCFPRNAGAAGKEASRQLSFSFGLEQSMDADEGMTVVLAYMANPSDGLCAVYLASIGQAHNGKITAWDETVEVWRRGEEPPPTKVVPPTAPAETVSAPVIRRGPRKAKVHGRR